MNQIRRQFLLNSTMGLGAAALQSLLPRTAGAAGDDVMQSIAPKAKRVIYLFQSGGPSHLDLFDYKPHLKDRFGEDLPDSVRGGQRLTGFTKNQKSLPVTPTKFRFEQCGESGSWVNTELLPHIGSVADDICFIRSMHTEAINHDPARTFLQTGAQLAGRPSMGSWVSYGLGSEAENLPAFMVLNSFGSCKRTPQPVSGRLWESGFLPSQYQGVKLQSVGDPVLYVSSPPGISRESQRSSLDALKRMNQIKAQSAGDPEIDARIEQYEMAFRMQASVPELTDISSEPESTFQLYGEDAKTRGSFAANCLIARRMAERGVRYIQLYHVGWDHHQDVPRDLPLMCGDVDQASAGLLIDLKQRGLLDDTLVIWGGEFGRTTFSQGKATEIKYGRDHHGRVFSLWMAGGGIKPGTNWGSSDDYGYSVAENGVHVHDLQATILHLLGINHTRLTYKFQGRDFRLTDVHGHVVNGILS
ncbi:MAG: DUF1501 domain-containing protein [Verrucomicrobiales bacterium]|nr:DUF1501 domain-containing protein [Verrucomicrobiales bacterium]